MALSEQDQRLARYLIDARRARNRQWLFWSRVISMLGGGAVIWMLLRDGAVSGGELGLVLFFYFIQPLALANWIYTLQVERREALRMLGDVLPDAAGEASPD
jgi:hypothetical protein